MDLQCPLPVNFQNHVEPIIEHKFHRLLRCAVTVIKYLGKFQKFAIFYHVIEDITADKVIMLSIYLAWAWGTGGV